MTTVLTWGNGSCKAACDAKAARLNGGFLRIFSGADVLLAEMTLGNPAYGAATTANPAIATANAITRDSSANATGTAATYRLVQSDGTTVEGTGICTAVGGGGSLELVTLTVTAGLPFEISSHAIRQA